ncbi:hypothetical protein IQ07DRAFT_590960 [Pyrenochaeta sp. DS3sAY3a]|nr:hypothetical protein IQ07DRAFT_590960 [Pyrenochaeta sp. DS3sAY3a]
MPNQPITNPTQPTPPHPKDSSHLTAAHRPKIPSAPHPKTQDTATQPNVSPPDSRGCVSGTPLYTGRSCFAA